jgi:hypothetical protein
MFFFFLFFFGLSFIFKLITIKFIHTDFFFFWLLSSLSPHLLIVLS